MFVIKKNFKVNRIISTSMICIRYLMIKQTLPMKSPIMITFTLSINKVSKWSICTWKVEMSKAILKESFGFSKNVLMCNHWFTVCPPILCSSQIVKLLVWFHYYVKNNSNLSLFIYSIISNIQRPNSERTKIKTTLII